MIQPHWFVQSHSFLPQAFCTCCSFCLECHPHLHHLASLAPGGMLHQTKSEFPGLNAFRVPCIPALSRLQFCIYLCDYLTLSSTRLLHEGRALCVVHCCIPIAQSSTCHTWQPPLSCLWSDTPHALKDEQNFEGQILKCRSHLGPTSCLCQRTSRVGGISARTSGCPPTEPHGRSLPPSPRWSWKGPCLLLRGPTLGPACSLSLALARPRHAAPKVVNTLLPRRAPEAHRGGLWITMVWVSPPAYYPSP